MGNPTRSGSPIHQNSNMNQPPLEGGAILSQSVRKEILQRAIVRLQVPPALCVCALLSVMSRLCNRPPRSPPPPWRPCVPPMALSVGKRGDKGTEAEPVGTLVQRDRNCHSVPHFADVRTVSGHTPSVPSVQRLQRHFLSHPR